MQSKLQTGIVFQALNYDMSEFQGSKYGDIEFPRLQIRRPLVPKAKITTTSGFRGPKYDDVTFPGIMTRMPPDST